MRALQAFIRLQELPAGPLSLGDAAAEAVALVDLVLPTHDVTLTAAGDATVVADSRRARLLARRAPGRRTRAQRARGAIELTVRTEGRDAVVAATGGGELRLPAAEVVT